MDNGCVSLTCNVTHSGAKLGTRGARCERLRTRSCLPVGPTGLRRHLPSGTLTGPGARIFLGLFPAPRLTALYTYTPPPPAAA